MKAHSKAPFIWLGARSTVTNSASKEQLVGGLTFVVLLLIVFLTSGNTNKLDEENSYMISAVFGRIDGLVEGADVRMGGVKIGQVQSADINENYRAVVFMGIDKSIEIPTDTSAAIQTDGLFGSKFIELEPGGEEEMMKNGSVVDMVQSSVVVEELLELIISEGKAKRAKRLEENEMGSSHDG